MNPDIVYGGRTVTRFDRRTGQVSRQLRLLSTDPGMHRFTWDVHYQPLDVVEITSFIGGRGGLPIQAIPHDTALAPNTPWVSPGTYTVRLTVDGRSHTQPISVRQDRRVQTPPEVMQQVYTLTDAMYFGALDAQQAAISAQSMRDQVATLRPRAKAAIAEALDSFIDAALAVAGRSPGSAGPGRGGPGPLPAVPTAESGAQPAETLWAVRTQLAGLMNSMQAADVAPTANTLAAVKSALATAGRVMGRWETLTAVDLAGLNAKLKAAGLAEIVR